MNRTFLIFLMVGTALMIAVIGPETEPDLPGYMPWEVAVLENGTTRAFGITLGKTRIQDANQILSSFPDNQLLTNKNAEPRLFAVYDNLNMGGFIAKIQLEYGIDLDDLDDLQNAAQLDKQTVELSLSSEQEIQLLGSTVKSMRYLPYIDYEPALILKHFGQADNHIKASNTVEHWIYNDKGIEIILDLEGPDVFIYTPVTRPLPETEEFKDSAKT